MDNSFHTDALNANEVYLECEGLKNNVIIIKLKLFN